MTRPDRLPLFAEPVAIPEATTVALALVDPSSLGRLADLATLTVDLCGRALGWTDPPLGGTLGGRHVTRLHLGPDGCERLLPSPRALRSALAFAAERGLAVSLATPLLADAALSRLRALIALLPEGSEVVGNDWGTLSLVARDFPVLVPVAGRLLCKMIKDPRLPSSDWVRLYPAGYQDAPFAAVLARLGVKRIELDVPPFARAGDLGRGDLPVAVHAPFGIATKGRICRVGSLRRDDRDRFAIGARCGRECLTYTTTLERPGATQDLPTRMRGTAMLYRHDATMETALLEAAARGRVDRIILSGDWH